MLDVRFYCGLVTCVTKTCVRGWLRSIHNWNIVNDKKAYSIRVICNYQNYSIME